MTFFSNDFLLILEGIKVKKVKKRIRQKNQNKETNLARSISTLFISRNSFVFMLKLFFKMINKNERVLQLARGDSPILTSREALKKKIISKTVNLVAYPTLILSEDTEIIKLAKALNLKCFKEATLLSQAAFFSLVGITGLIIKKRIYPNSNKITKKKLNVRLIKKAYIAKEKKKIRLPRL